MLIWEKYTDCYIHIGRNPLLKYLGRRWIFGAKYTSDEEILYDLNRHVAEYFHLTTLPILLHPFKGHSFAGFELYQFIKLDNNVIRDILTFTPTARNKIEEKLFRPSLGL